MPAWRPYCSGVGPGGGLGFWGRSASGLGVTAGPGGLGPWLVVPPEAMGWCCAWAHSGVGVFDASVPPQGGGGGGGPIEAG